MRRMNCTFSEICKSPTTTLFSSSEDRETDSSVGDGSGADAAVQETPENESEFDELWNNASTGELPGSTM